MRVLITTPSPKKPGGVGEFYRLLRPHFRCSTTYFTVGSRETELGPLTVMLRLMGDFARFFKTLRRGHDDLVLLNPSFVAKSVMRDGVFLLIAKCLGKKVVVFFHGWDLDFERTLRRFFLPLFRFVFFRADAFVVLGSRFQRSLEAMGCRKPIHRETTAVADECFLALPPTRREGFHVLFLGRIEKAKGIHEAVDAFHILQSKHPSARLTLAGDGTELESVRGTIAEREIPGVSCPGFVTGEAKAQVLAAADVYLFPSHAEGMPISVLEAMAYGLPVITRPVGGIPDFFEDGKMGFLTETKDPEVFARLLERLINDPEMRARIGEFNRRYARERFAPARAAERIERVHRMVMSGEEEAT